MPRARHARRQITYMLEAPLRRYWLLVVPIVTLGIVAGAIAQLRPPRYRASAQMRADWEASDAARLAGRGIDLAERRRQAVHLRITERKLLEDVLREASPYAVAAEPDAVLDAQVERLLADLRVRSISSSSFVIEFTHAVPATAAGVANLVAQALDSGASSSGSRAQLEMRVAEARLLLREKTEALVRVGVDPGRPEASAANGPSKRPSAAQAERLTATEIAELAARARAVAEHDQAQRAYQARLEELQAAISEPVTHGPTLRFERVREAAVPELPESPSRLLFVLVGLLGGLAIGVLAAVVAEQRDRSVRGPEDLVDVLPVPLLATLPLVRVRRSGKSRIGKAP